MTPSPTNRRIPALNARTTQITAHHPNPINHSSDIPPHPRTQRSHHTNHSPSPKSQKSQFRQLLSTKNSKPKTKNSPHLNARTTQIPSQPYTNRRHIVQIPKITADNCSKPLPPPSAPSQQSPKRSNLPPPPPLPYPPCRLSPLFPLCYHATGIHLHSSKKRLGKRPCLCYASEDFPLLKFKKESWQGILPVLSYPSQSCVM